VKARKLVFPFIIVNVVHATTHDMKKMQFVLNAALDHPDCIIDIVI